MEGISYKNIAADGTVDTTHAVIVYGFAVLAAAGQVDLYDGQDTNGTLLFSEAARDVYDFGCGIVFPNGCYVDLTAPATATIFYQRLS